MNIENVWRMAGRCSKNVNICNISCNFMTLCYYSKKYVICVNYIKNISKYTCSAHNFTFGIRTMISYNMSGLVSDFVHPQILRCAQHRPIRTTNGLSIMATFKLIMSEEICDNIIRKTNRKAKNVMIWNM